MGRERNNIYNKGKCISNSLEKGIKFKEAAEKCGVPPKEVDIAVDANKIITNYIQKEIGEVRDRLTQLFDDLEYYRNAI